MYFEIFLAISLIGDCQSVAGKCRAILAERPARRPTLRLALQAKLGVAAGVNEPEEGLNFYPGTGVEGLIRAVTLECQVAAGILPHHNNAPHATFYVHGSIIETQVAVLLVRQKQHFIHRRQRYLRLSIA
ncbi:hypothetical protein [Hymenobacter pini]|uniref:hypothetical protein n=1 Tax=Hymenobacter pini TaxID=2880879 RepID=UPI001CF3D29E|nr:hypothetical protein [Hymenobacter pini]MCA8833112.1 hypothetical protein [Hymenobacter pini]